MAKLYLTFQFNKVNLTQVTVAAEAVAVERHIHTRAINNTDEMRLFFADYQSQGFQGRYSSSSLFLP